MAVSITLLLAAGAIIRLGDRPLDTGAPVISVPPGFELEIAAGPPLVKRPIVIDIDEKGRLYVAESSGSNDNVKVQLEERPHSILRLEDTDGDGRYDRRTVFADKMMFPEGVLWHDGSVYVAAPPSIWKLTDTDRRWRCRPARRVVQRQDSHKLRQRLARTLRRPRRLDLLVQRRLRRADLRASRPSAVCHPERPISSAVAPKGD